MFTIFYAGMCVKWKHLSDNLWGVFFILGWIDFISVLSFCVWLTE